MRIDFVNAPAAICILTALAYQPRNPLPYWNLPIHHAALRMGQVATLGQVSGRVLLAHYPIPDGCLRRPHIFRSLLASLPPRISAVS